MMQEKRNIYHFQSLPAGRGEKRCSRSWRHLLRALACCMLFLCGLEAGAQTTPLYTGAWAAPTLYNPAAVGATDFLRIRGLGRMQWLGIENAPKSFSAVADIPFRLLGKRFGGGVNFTQEGLGLFSNTYVNGQLGIRFNKLGGIISAGIQVGYFGSSFKGSEVYIPDDDDYHDSNDPAIPKQDVGGGSIDFGLGVMYTHPKFHVGLSLQHAANPTVKLNTKGTTTSDATTDNHEFETYAARTVYLNAGSNIPIKNTLIELQPDMLLAYDMKTFSGILSVKGWYNKLFFAGLAYRWDDAVAINIGAEFKNFVLGYSYEIPTSAILKASSGSHEILIGYRLKLDFNGKNRNKHRSIRLM